MEFALSEDQRLMQDSLRSALTRACPLERVRATVDRGLVCDTNLWSVVSRLGLPALLVPEAHGGLGLSLLDTVLAAEELGRRVAPVPFIGSAVLAPLALCAAGSAEQQARWLPRIADGSAVIGVALHEALVGARNGAGVSEERGRLSGSSLFVLDGAKADAYIVADRSGAMWLLDGHASGLERVALPAIDGTRPTIELHLESVEADALPEAGADVLARLRDAAWIVAAADTLGAGWAMIDQAVTYSADRRQFGRAIGTFQAVKHMCAEMAAELEINRGLVWYAAHAFDERAADAPLYAAHAKAQLAECGRFVARTATEVHGGMGITDELGLHHWFKRIGFDRQLYGGPERARAQAAEHQALVAA
jgi:alkylation response protein AidB-like acyl-CoA dehydrogenase